MTVLYFLLPLLFTFKVLPFPLWLILIVMGLSVIVFIRYDNTFDKKQHFNWKEGKKYLLPMLLLFLVAAVVMVVTIWFVDASKLFIYPKENPGMLATLSIVYPLFSVIPQELAYRTFFYHRYGELFTSKWAKILVSALFFSFGHIIYKDPLVLFLTFIAGLIFAYRYHQSKSFLLTSIEHSLYGMWLFVSGLGVYFISSMVQ